MEKIDAGKSCVIHFGWRAKRKDEKKSCSPKENLATNVLSQQLLRAFKGYNLKYMLSLLSPCVTAAAAVVPCLTNTIFGIERKEKKADAIFIKVMVAFGRQPWDRNVFALSTYKKKGIRNK